jgi:uncharacterized protein (DUF1800 family)
MPTLTRLDAAHLWRRAGFGASPAQLDEYTGMDREAAVDRMLDATAAPPVQRPAVDDHDDEYGSYVRAYEWWIERMRTTPSPLVEKLVLFWHGHFCSEQRKVHDMGAMFGQNQLFRSGALGGFRELCRAVAVDPAMLFYLDNATNRAGREQENFARELMELFTIGIGNFTEADVIAMAKAWTGHNTVGWNGTRNDHTYVFVPSQHDDSMKRLFGIERRWNGPETIDEIIDGSRRVACSRFIATKLYRFFVHATPSPAVIDELAATFRASGLSIRALVRAVFLHESFWAPTTRYALVKTPTEFVVDVLRRVGLPAVHAGLPWANAGMGQVLFNPPNVAGWGENATWLSTAALGGRGAWLWHVRHELARVGAFSGLEPLSAAAGAQRIIDTLGILEPSATSRSVLEQWFTAARSTDPWSLQRNALVAGAMLPEFQLA